MRIATYLLLTAIFCLSLHSRVEAQNASMNNQDLQDSLSTLYQKYFELQRMTQELQQYNQQLDQQIDYRVDSVMQDVQGNLQQINKNYKYFNEVLESNNQKISSISETQLFTNKTLFERNKTRILNSTDFIESAGTALNTLNLTNQIFGYTDQITALNNPDNEELGFSLTKRVDEIMEETIFKGRNKINKIKRDKFMGVVQNILDNPLTGAITTNIPVVGAIKSIVDMVTNVSIEGDDVEIEDLTEMKKKLEFYVAHYQGLDDARKSFDAKISTIEVRTDALKLLLRNLVVDRIKSLYPEVDPARLEMPLNKLTLNYYNYRQVQSEVNKIVAMEFVGPRGTIAYEMAAHEGRLIFPDYAVSQARFIMDEIESISTEYEAALNSYQSQIETVLNRSKSIGNDYKIDQKIEDLRKSKQAVVAAIRSTLNLDKVKQSFQSLVWEKSA